jgi:lysophospholipase L1-like esterase
MKRNLFSKINIVIVLASLLNVLVFSNVFGKPFFSYYPAKDANDETIIVTGDSYAGYFASYECNKDYNIIIYAEAGRSTKENYEMMLNAVDLYPKTVVISLGVNDHNKNESPSDFKTRIEEIVKICKRRNKRVVLHTYMDYGPVLEKEDKTESGFDVQEYDEILKDIGSRYNNVFYIDMSDYEKEQYLQADKIHYNTLFYDELYNRMTTAMMLF